MTTYTAITNGQIDQDSPITQALMTALRDNPIALTEGASGAPRIYGNSFAQLSDLPVLTVSAADTYALPSGMFTFVSGTNPTNSTSFVTAISITVVQFTGSARFKGSHRTSNSGTTSFLKVYKNGVEIGSWTSNSTAFVTRSIDVSIVPGDVIRWDHRVNFSTQSSTFSGGSPSANKTYATFQAYGEKS